MGQEHRNDPSSFSAGDVRRAVESNVEARRRATLHTPLGAAVSRGGIGRTQRRDTHSAWRGSFSRRDRRERFEGGFCAGSFSLASSSSSSDAAVASSRLAPDEDPCHRKETGRSCSLGTPRPLRLRPAPKRSSLSRGAWPRLDKTRKAR
jgi:hypothetical protein